MNAITNQTVQPQQIPNPVNNEPKPDKEKISVLDKVVDYMEPREDTTGDQPYSSPKSALIGGAIKGFVSTGFAGAAAGAASGFVGVKVGEETGSLTTAMTASAVTGAGALLLTGAASTAILGGPIGTVATVGVMAAAGAVGGAVGSAVESLQGKEQTKLSKAISTAAATAAGAATGAAIGAIGGPITLAAGAAVGAISAFSGAKITEDIQKNQENPSTKDKIKTAALAATMTGAGGALAGAGLTVATSAAPAVTALSAGSTAIIGSLTGATATISGSRTADIRDGSMGAMAAATVVNAFTGLGGSAVSLSASIGGAVGARAKSTAGKIIFSAATGGAIGAATGAIAGPTGIAIGAALGAGASVAGAIAGPKVQQGIRNFTSDLQKKITPLTEKVSGFLIDKLGDKKGLIAIGALTGAMSSVPMASLGAVILGPIGAAVAVAGSAVVSGIKFAKVAKDLEETKVVQQSLAQQGPQLEDINHLMCVHAYKQIEPQLDGMSVEQKQAFFNDLSQQSLAELTEFEPEIKQFSKQLGMVLREQMKDSLKEIKDKDEKEAFINAQISESKGELTQVFANQVLTIMQAKQEEQTQKEENS